MEAQRAPLSPQQRAIECAIGRPQPALRQIAPSGLLQNGGNVLRRQIPRSPQRGLCIAIKHQVQLQLILRFARHRHVLRTCRLLQDRWQFRAGRRDPVQWSVGTDGDHRWNPLIRLLGESHQPE
ncbi:MAG: hypothetical protein BWZ07_02889 [Alphaproteobacteria bacterium ADurb.BinA280]|nr:MAG: hypothetical protein BWZ07_02889 [Alphaproteobacteria bacterium ADurb.BinA280]